MKLKYALFGALLLVGANAMACYTVYDANNRIVYQGTLAPVDMSIPLHQALEQRFPRGAQMVFDQGSTCGSIGVAQVPRPTGKDVPPNTIRMEGRPAARPNSSGPAPLFTDRQTAERAHLPHTQVAGDIVVVPPAAAERAMRPTVTVLPSTTYARAPEAPNTNVLGAGPAPKRQIVITEMRDGTVRVNEY